MSHLDHSQLVAQLQTVLHNLTTSTYPLLPSPPECKRRASVALILRIKPFFSHWPPVDQSRPTTLDSFFSHEWAQKGDPEVLFIKRASRKGDRWTSHIALPGGKRDPEDEDDKATAVRETWEEVGLDLKSYAIECGNLPQRIVTTHWGKKPLLVLCPYVFLLTTNEIPPLKLQPSEVAATHWVPLRSLLAREQRAVVHEDVSRQLVSQETGVRRWMAGMILGKMIFAAINLVPSESLHSVESPSADGGTLQDNRFAQSLSFRERSHRFIRRLWSSDLFNQYPLPRKENPLLLWGLTLGMISDFLALMPPHDALTLWTYPTFTPLDVRFAIWLFTYRFKNRKRAELQAGNEFRDARPSFGTASESVILSTEFPGVGSSTVIVPRTDETGFHGLGSGAGTGMVKDRRAAVQTMLEGYFEPVARLLLPEITDRARYYDIVRRAVTVALIGRVSFFALITVIAWKRFRRRA